MIIILLYCSCSNNTLKHHTIIHSNMHIESNDFSAFILVSFLFYIITVMLIMLVVINMKHKI